MTQIVLILFGVAIVLILLSRRTRERIVGICAAALEQTVRKNANKEKILTLLREKGDMANEEIREQLGVSRQSVARYMNELEKEGTVRQVGDTGRGVIYRLNDSTG